MQKVSRKVLLGNKQLLSDVEFVQEANLLQKQHNCKCDIAFKQ